MHQNPDRDRYTSDEEGTIVNKDADELKLIALSKRPTRLLPRATVNRTKLEPSVQEATSLKKISDNQVPTVGSLKGTAK